MGMRCPVKMEDLLERKGLYYKPSVKSLLQVKSPVYKGVRFLVEKKKANG